LELFIPYTSRANEFVSFTKKESSLLTLNFCNADTVPATGANNLSKAGWSWGCVSAVTRDGRTIWIADAHRDNGKRLAVHANEKLCEVR
jgi:hypothetical protein